MIIRGLKYTGLGAYSVKIFFPENTSQSREQKTPISCTTLLFVHNDCTALSSAYTLTPYYSYAVISDHEYVIIIIL